jgi:hypothetical protein
VFWRCVSRFAFVHILIFLKIHSHNAHPAVDVLA